MGNTPKFPEVEQDHRVEVIPPSDNVFHAFARRVCEERARVENDARLLDPEVIAGLAALLKIAAVVKARQLNRERAALVDCAGAEG